MNKLPKIFKPEQCYFISDTHFLHKNVILYDKRPFNSIEEHDETIINNWNSVVGNDDFVFHLGDFSFHRKKDELINAIKQLNGNIIFIKGNHDKVISKYKEVQDLFYYYTDYQKITILDNDKLIKHTSKDNKQEIVLFHYPILEWSGFFKGTWHLYGHVHNNIKHPAFTAFDVSINSINYKPISYYEVKKWMAEYQ